MKRYWRTGCHVLLIALLLFMLLVACVKSNQTIPAAPDKYTFQGEYSQDGGAWTPLEEGAVPSALDGGLILRGGFDRDVPAGEVVTLYLDHIAYCVYVNQEFVACSDGWELGTSVSTCVQRWESFVSPGIGPEDVVELRLRNSHRFGNADAYAELLGSIYPCASRELKVFLDPETFPARCVGLLVLILSVGVAGVALTFSMMQEAPIGRQLWPLTLGSLCVGEYILLDVIDVSIWSYLNVFNTYMTQCCIMLAVLELGVFLTVYLTGRVRRTAQAVVRVEGVLLAGIALWCLTGRGLIYDTRFLWTVAQLFFCPVLLICCLYEWRRGERKQPLVLLSCVIQLSAIVLDLLNLFFYWWPSGIVTKACFVVLFVVHLANGIRIIPVHYRKSEQVDQLIGDLKSSRIVLAMSQIRAHFIFNILNAISGMCKYDPEKADETVIRFARYLRANIDIMQDNPLIPFRTELRHLEDYFALEQLRFGNRVRFVTELAVEDFMLPLLVLQPIVENSIKHGLQPKESGGTVILRTWTERGAVQISIEDDGVGFDPEMVSGKEQSVGLKNVRFRLKHIVRGALDVKSRPGQGTVVTISIPYEEAKKCG